MTVCRERLRAGEAVYTSAYNVTTTHWEEFQCTGDTGAKYSLLCRPWFYKTMVGADASDEAYVSDSILQDHVIAINLTNVYNIFCFA